MTLAKACIYAGGALTLLVAVFHTRFYRLFRWEKPLQTMGFPNNSIFYTIHIALLLLFFLVAFLSFRYAGELEAGTGLALGLAAGLALFWLWRAVWQITYFSEARGPMHAGLTACFFLLAACYAVPAVMALRKMLS